MVPWVIPDSGSSDRAHRDCRFNAYSAYINWVCMGCIQPCKAIEKRVA